MSTSAQTPISVEDRKAESDRGEHAPGRERPPSEMQYYGIEFVKKCNDDLNYTLVIAGLLSAVISAFIVYIQPQLQEDPNDTSAMVLRVILYKMDNTAFGGDVPKVTQWHRPPGPTVAAQILLFLSLALTTTSVLLALVAKQLLDLYTTVGSLSHIEEGQGIHAMLKGFSLKLHLIFLLLPALLQFALLFFACGLAVYIWNVNVAVAAIVLVAAICSIIILLFFSGFALANLSLAHAKAKASQDGS